MKINLKLYGKYLLNQIYFFQPITLGGASVILSQRIDNPILTIILSYMLLIYISTVSQIKDLSTSTKYDRIPFLHKTIMTSLAIALGGLIIMYGLETIATITGETVAA